MLTQVSPQIKALAQTPSARPYQVKPPYVCFACGHPAGGIQPWPVRPAALCDLDLYAINIGYLILPCKCYLDHPGCSRVAILGDAITPLWFASDTSDPWLERVAYNCSITREALDFLAKLVAGPVAGEDKISYSGVGE